MSSRPLPQFLRDELDSVHGVVRDQSIPWQRSAWLARFPEQRVSLEALPDEVSRESVRVVVRDSDAIGAFVVSMVWGYGRVGYGRFRTHRVLAHPGNRDRLQRVVDTTRAEGGLAGFEAFASDRPKHLGPAFGTKLLAFTEPETSAEHPRALVLDRLVRWVLGEELGWWPVVHVYDTTGYWEYCSVLASWARELSLAPSEVELLLFRRARRIGATS